jgi:hypothetical protein
MALQRTRRPSLRSGRSRCSLGSPLNAVALAKRSSAAAIVAVLTLLSATSCDELATQPRRGALFRLRDPAYDVVFRVEAQLPETIAKGQQLIDSGETYFAVGVIRHGDGGFNVPYVWHLDSADVRFDFITPEQCQTTAGDFRGEALEYWIRFGYICLPGRVEARER